MENFERYIGQIFDRRYRIEKIIGIGGMAIVFEASDLVMKRTVAVKMLKDEIARDAQAVKRFINESKAVSMLSHPNIVSIYDVSVKENLKYIVMEHVDGITLKNYMQKKGALSTKETIYYTEQILRALEHAHSKGIIHRDIKPQNILLLKNGQIKVTDFGIAKLPNAETVTMTDKAIGTVYYISPEQASGRQIDPRSDLYSLGVMMYEMATGKLPFDADSPVSVALMQVNDTPVKPREINPGIPEGLEQIILGAMEKEPENRFQTASQMLRYTGQLAGNPNVIFKIPKHEAQPSVQTGKLPSARVVGQNGSTDPTQLKVKKQSRTMFPVILGVSTAFLIVMVITGISMLSALLDAQSKNSPTSIEVPSLVGAVCNDELLNQFDPAIYKINITQQVDYTYAKGTIIEQEPKGGVKKRVLANKQFCELNIVVSLGADSVRLPDFTMQKYLNVEIEMRKLGLIPDIIKIESPTIDTDYVLKTVPAAGEELDVGSTVQVYVSLGTAFETVSVPDFRGLTAERAYRAMKNSQGTLMFAVGEITYEHSDKYPEGQIIDQSKSDGTKVPKGTAIDFVISLGPEEEETTAEETTGEETTKPEETTKKPETSEPVTTAPPETTPEPETTAEPVTEPEETTEPVEDTITAEEPQPEA